MSVVFQKSMSVVCWDNDVELTDRSFCMQERHYVDMFMW